MNGLEPDCSEFVEVDPTGRYGRYNEILGKGASKIVYRAFDEYEGIEVAWNQVKLFDFLQSPEDLERLYCEIHLLKTLKHKNIMKFYTSWVDTAKRNINFVTEMFTSGTLRQYRMKHKKVNIRAVKHWCRQILKGLLYLHSHDPPVIHRDLKCDNIFVNGNQGEVKIGDLGLAAILRKSHAAHCVGTPEFMAPEVYEEAYNELVDIYSFGMCILEMVTFEYPYSECTHPAQIYKKVISGKKPDALYKVKDPEVREFVEKCLAIVSLRLSARELLNDPFLQIDDCDPDLRPLDCGRVYDDFGPLVRQPYNELHHSINTFCNSGYLNGYGNEAQNKWGYPAVEVEQSGIELFEYQDDDDEDDHPANVDISILGKKGDEGGIFLRLRIADKEAHVRNIYFPFDIETDTALSVATEMVAELDITDQDVTKIADMIDGEISSLVPEWRPGPGIEETPHIANQSNFCNNCASNRTSTGSLMDYLSNNQAMKTMQLIQCCRNGCASMHGRFEEITFDVDGSDEHHVIEGAPQDSSQSEGLNYQEIWGHQHESRELSSVSSGQSHSDEECEKTDHPIQVEDEIGAKKSKRKCLLRKTRSLATVPSMLRWLKAKYQMELQKVKDRQLGIPSKPPKPKSNNKERETGHHESLLSLLSKDIDFSKSFANDNIFASRYEDRTTRSCPDSDTQRDRKREAKKEFVKNFESTSSLLPNSIHRTTSLPVDAVDI